MLMKSIPIFNGFKNANGFDDTQNISTITLHVSLLIT